MKNFCTKIIILILCLISTSSQGAGKTAQTSIEKQTSSTDNEDTTLGGLFKNKFKWLKDKASEIAQDLGSKFQESTITSAADIPLKKARSQFTGTPHQNDPTSINSGQISNEETTIINLRQTKNNSALKDLTKLDIPKEKTLNIAICTSGGGYRAMIATLGLLKGLEEARILDTVQYISTLSGSAWGTGFWISSKKSLSDFIEQVKNNIQKNVTLPTPITDSEQIKNTVKNFVAKFVYDQPLSSVDIWGALIGNNLVGTQTLKLSEQQNLVQNGDLPFPIYTAVSATSFSPLTYDWYEFNPYNVRNIRTNNYIPTWAFGRKFERQQFHENGHSSLSEKTSSGDVFPEELPLNFLLGICGSAFTVNVKEIIKDMESNSALSDLQATVLDYIISKDEKALHISSKRAIPAEVYNFAPKNGSKEIIILIDAGIDFNLPFPPLLQKDRNIDLIIALDASASVKNAPALKGAESYATQHSISGKINELPKIDYSDIDKKPISIFKEAGKPTVIYVPYLFVNECGDSYCSTFNFGYGNKEFDMAFNASKNTVTENFNQIKNAIIEAQKEKLA